MTEHLLMALRPGDDYWESEPVVVRHFGKNQVSFQLDDGEELIFDRTELSDALEREGTGSVGNKAHTGASQSPDLLLDAPLPRRRRGRR